MPDDFRDRFDAANLREILNNPCQTLKALAEANEVLFDTFALRDDVEDRNEVVRLRAKNRYIEPLLQDDNAEVRETAEDALAELQN